MSQALIKQNLALLELMEEVRVLLPAIETFMVCSGSTLEEARMNKLSVAYHKCDETLKTVRTNHVGDMPTVS